MTKFYLAVFVAAMLAIPASASGQTYATDRGAVVLGGSVRWSSSGGDLYENNEGDRYNSVLVNPRVLYFVAPGLGIGGNLYVESESQGDFNATTIAVGPAAAYFFGGPDSSALPYISGFLGYGKTTTSGWDGSGLSFGAGAGLAFLLSPSVALTAGAWYRLDNTTVDQLDQSFGGNTMALEIGVEAFLF